MVVIEINGVTCTVDGGEWQCDDATLLPLLPPVTVLDDRMYYPSIDLALANLAMQLNVGRLLSQPPPMGNEDNRVY